MNFVKGMNKPTQYETVEDAKDLRIPVQSEEAFEHGIAFKCKYIGTEEIPRPNSRVEIVAAMRRIRYEHKYRNIKKRKVFMDISADGVKIYIRKKKKRGNTNPDESSLFIMHYPINRVFYVSHDSQDLKILSYIARGEDGVFRCSVFKALKKSQAMHVVRTIGQAFEVCHKINLERDKNSPKDTSKKMEIETDEKSPDETDIDEVQESDIDTSVSHVETMELQRPVSTLVTDLDTVRDLTDLPPPLIMPPPTQTLPLLINGQLGSEKHGPFSLQQLQQLYHQQLLLQMQEAEAGRTELSRVRSQLKSEADTRAQAQQQVNRLLAQNRELIAIIHKLMAQLQDKYSKDNLAEPYNETWMLSQLSTNTSLFTGSNIFSNSSNGLGTVNIDFDSQVFDNTNTGPSPRHPVVTASTPNKGVLTFDDLIARNSANIFQHKNKTSLDTNTVIAAVDNQSQIGNDNQVGDRNPFTPTTSTSNDVYKFAFNDTNSKAESTIETEIS